MRKNNTLPEAGLGVCIIAALLIALILTPPGAQASPQIAVPLLALVSSSEPVAEPAPSSPATIPDPVAGPHEPAGTGALAAYVLEAMLAWKKPGKRAVPYAEVARDIAIVSLEHAPIFKGDFSRARGAIVLATLAFFEGGFLSYVDDLSCNSKRWRNTTNYIWAKDICDDGHAWSLFQIHTEDQNWNDGIRLTPDGEWRYDNSNSPEKITGSMLGDRKLAIKVALAFVRKSVNGTHGLCGYTGDKGCEKASLRWEWAKRYTAKRPYAP
jgi:hypothetical protein